MSALTYTFNGASFFRAVAQGDNTWFPKAIQMVAEPVLQSDGNGGEYLFIGSSALNGELSVNAYCTSSTDRDTLIDSIGVSSSLSNSIDTTDALLVSASPLHRIGPYYPILLLFKAVN